jgi:dihydroorotate dehydrogenase electron transfer subunit
MAVVETTPAVHAADVVDRREPAPGIVVLGFRAPELAASVRPGQFVMTVVPGGERAALPLAVYEASDNRISLMLVIVGPRTAAVAAAHVGAQLELLGPLGNGFDIDALGEDVGFIAGGVGIASVLLAARAVVARGRKAHLYYGARNAASIVDVHLFSEDGIGVSPATDDGSLVFRGTVVDAMKASRKLPTHTGLAACGPTPMLHAVARTASELGVRAQVSLEEAFGCGVGACWGCVVPHAVDAAGAPDDLIGASGPLPTLAVTRGDDGRPFAYVRICREGPVFWTHALRW